MQDTSLQTCSKVLRRAENIVVPYRAGTTLEALELLFWDAKVGCKGAGFTPRFDVHFQ